MKLRIAPDSVRLRLKPSEVARLAAEGRVEDHLDFGASTLTYSLAASPRASAVAVSFENGCIAVILPESTARRWTGTNEICIESAQNSLTILIEKDFRCMHKDPADTDVYPNPMVISDI